MRKRPFRAKPFEFLTFRETKKTLFPTPFPRGIYIPPVVWENAFGKKLGKHGTALNKEFYGF